MAGAPGTGKTALALGVAQELGPKVGFSSPSPSPAPCSSRLGSLLPNGWLGSLQF